MKHSIRDIYHDILRNGFVAKVLIPERRNYFTVVTISLGIHGPLVQLGHRCFPKGKVSIYEP